MHGASLWCYNKPYQMPHDLKTQSITVKELTT